jgi:hypothetical protein
MIYFQTNPIDPYTNNSNLWTMVQKPFEKQYRSQGLSYIFGPGYAQYNLSVLSLTYESVGMRWYPGFGVVKEEYLPREQHEQVGVLKQYGGDTSTDTLKWATKDSGAPPTDVMYFGEHPEFSYGGGIYKVTFPFAPSASEMFEPGSVNDDAWTPYVLNMNPFPQGTLKYIGMEAESSVVIPDIGIYTGLMRTRKTFIFNYRTRDWNYRWRARDQSWNLMLSASGANYIQYPYVNFNSVDWWL